VKWFHDLKIGTKLLTSFAVVAVIAGLIGWVGLAGISGMKTRGASLYYDKLVPIRDLGYANAAFLIARTEVRSMLGTKDKAKRKEFVAIIDGETKKTEAYIES
jgi:methyl-accepting chemotaxis protein